MSAVAVLNRAVQWPADPDNRFYSCINSLNFIFNAGRLFYNHSLLAPRKENRMFDQPVSSNFISSRQLIGSAIHGPSGESLGKIEAFLLDPKTGMVSSLILTSGGVLGLAGKRIAVPWDMIAMDEANGTISINVDQEFINRLPPYSGVF